MVAGPSLRIVFLGTPEFALPSLEALIASRHKVLVVVSQPDRPRGRGQQLQLTPTKQVALRHDIPVLQPARVRDEAFLDSIRSLAPDLGIVAAFGRILPESLLMIPRLGMINVHASLLPKYRGAAPVQRAVLAGEDQTGVTIMRLVQELDAGPMLAALSLPVSPTATSGEVETSLARAGAMLLLEVVDALAENRAVETPQDASRATYAPKVTKEEGTIDWTSPAHVVHNRARGLQPWPLASATLGGVRYVIRRTLVAEGTSGLPPGSILTASGDDLIVVCGGGTLLRVLEIQPEGRRSMLTREFLAGRRIRAGERFDA